MRERALQELAALGGQQRGRHRPSLAGGGVRRLLAEETRVENVFDRRYTSFGTLGDASALYPQVNDPRFVTPGAPRAGWIGFNAEL